jgi:hypothetical protein
MVNANQRKLTHVYLRDHTYLLCLGSNIVRFPGLNFLYTKSDPLVPLLDDSTTPQPPLRELFVPHSLSFTHCLLVQSDKDTLLLALVNTNFFRWTNKNCSR